MTDEYLNLRQQLDELLNNSNQIDYEQIYKVSLELDKIIYKHILANYKQQKKSTKQVV